MKKILVILCFIGFSLFAGGQTATLVTLNGKGIYIRQGVSFDLKIPQNYKSGDKIQITEGTATLWVCSTGREVKIESKKEFPVPTTSCNKEIVTIPVSTTNYEYDKVRGELEPKIFPAFSKAKAGENIVLVMANDSIISSSLKLRLLEVSTMQNIVKDKEVGTTISLTEYQLKSGEKYKWYVEGTIKGMVTGKEKIANVNLFGEIEMLNDAHAKQLPVFDFTEKGNYLSAYDYYYQNELLFSAAALLQEAVKDVGGNSLYKFLYLKLIH